ncbi:MAG: alanine transaminase [Gammaproteobacteria bacterium]|jgi:alanine-synthesizing transaminase|nr:alanine transaminase [Gammaproteobacteria bacterium]
MSDFSRIARLPPYIFSVMDQLQQEVAATEVEVFDFGLGNPDQPTAPHIIEALNKAALDPAWHRYAPSRGIPALRKAISQWYGRRYEVDLDPESETIVTIGSKEGLAHLALAITASEDTVLVPSPCYPVHHFGFVIADAAVKHVPLLPDVDFLASLEETIRAMWPKPKLLVLNFPNNPTTQCVDRDFFVKIIDLAKEYGIWVLHDLAYADLVFDGYEAPSILQIPGAKEVAVESYTLSKTYNMAGWRVGFLCGNSVLIAALARIKSYLDYGSFAAVQVAAIAALEGPQESVAALCKIYQHRRDIMCAGLQAAGWPVNIPKASMFLWLKIPKRYQDLGSLEFAKLLLREAHVRVSPGIGFGEYGNQFIRISLVENDQRMGRALENIKRFMRS